MDSLFAFAFDARTPPLLFERWTLGSSGLLFSLFGPPEHARLSPFKREGSSKKMNSISSTMAFRRCSCSRKMLKFAPEQAARQLTIISPFYCNFDSFCTNKTIPKPIRSCSTRLWLFTFQCFSSRKTNPSFWRFSLTPSYAPKRKTEKFLCENLLVSKETKKFSIFYLLAFKRQKSKILG